MNRFDNFVYAYSNCYMKYLQPTRMNSIIGRINALVLFLCYIIYTTMEIKLQ